jgi:hypothetical protein
MASNRTITISMIAVICAVLAVPSGAHALPKGTKWQNCTTQDLNTTFGASCMHQADQDVMKGNSYMHMLFCGGGTTLCCTVDQSGQVINCRRPAGVSAAIQPSTQSGTISRGVEDAESEELTTVPDWVKDAAKKGQ